MGNLEHGIFIAQCLKFDIHGLVPQIDFGRTETLNLAQRGSVGTGRLGPKREWMKPVDFVGEGIRVEEIDGVISGEVLRERSVPAE